MLGILSHSRCVKTVQITSWTLMGMDIFHEYKLVEYVFIQ